MNSCIWGVVKFQIQDPILLQKYLNLEEKKFGDLQMNKDSKTPKMCRVYLCIKHVSQRSASQRKARYAEQRSRTRNEFG